MATSRPWAALVNGAGQQGDRLHVDGVVGLQAGDRITLFGAPDTYCILAMEGEGNARVITLDRAPPSPPADNAAIWSA